MSARVQRAGLEVAAPIADYVEREAAPDSGLDPGDFWNGLSEIIRDLTPRNRELIRVRRDLQDQIDAYHRVNPGQPDPVDYTEFLTKIGYLVPHPQTPSVTTSGVDEEIAAVAGPQLIVPLLNARFAVNAANARWGSLYDAYYGTDAIPDEGKFALRDGFNPDRGQAVIAQGRRLLDRVAPLQRASHFDATSYRVVNGMLEVAVGGEATTALVDQSAFAGYTGQPQMPTGILLLHHGLHVHIAIDREGVIGQTDQAGINDIIIESAVTTIVDLEDSVAAVDGDDKAAGYRNWLHLMRGTLSETVTKNGSTFLRELNPDRNYLAPDGQPFSVPGRSLLMIRNVGHLMTTDAVLDSSGEPVFEGILDAAMTALGALPDLRGDHRGTNSRTGSMYIVKPKMHGPEEVAFAVEVFRRVENLLSLPPNTVKMGIMDEERRTTVNLTACVAAASERLVFINTGFLDRTGDDIRTSLYAGPMVPKARMKEQPFMKAYEAANVETGIRAGLPGRAQIGKGMWAMPDLMGDMVTQKISHPRAGATTAWVPSPTAATLHALHYHDVDPFAVHAEIAEKPSAKISDILIAPLAQEGELTTHVVNVELDNNVQSILGYVVRWIDQGIGCSKVPDINGVALMEDRATLRISSQLLANWLAHGVITLDQLDASLHRLAGMVDAQNAHDPRYEKLVGPDGPGLAFRASRLLITDGANQPNGYTEPILHRIRRAKKQATSARRC